MLAGIRNLQKAFGMENMRVILLTIFLQAFGFSFFMQFNQVYLIKKFQFDEKSIGLLFAYIGLWIAFTQGVIVRKISARFKSEQVLRVSLLGMSFTLVAILLPNQWWLLLFINPFIAIFQGSTQPNQTNLVSQMASRDNQGEILGIQQSIASIAFTIPPVLAGFMVSFDYRLPILASACMLLLAWLNFFFPFQKAGCRIAPSVAAKQLAMAGVLIKTIAYEPPAFHLACFAFHSCFQQLQPYQYTCNQSLRKT